MAARFEALGWHVQHVKDGNTDLGSLRSALDAAKKDPRPSLIKVRCFLAVSSLCHLAVLWKAVAVVGKACNVHACVLISALAGIGLTVEVREGACRIRRMAQPCLSSKGVDGTAASCEHVA